MAISSPLQSKVPTGSAKTIKKFQTILLNRTKVRREIFQQQTILQNRRIENERRKQREDELEAPNLVTKPKGAAGLIAGSAKGFFERLVGFLSYLTAGWIINNLPTWISMGKEFIARTQQMGKILGGFITNTTDIFKNFTKLLGAGLTNLMKFDFLDTSGRVKSAFDDLNLSVENWGTGFENAIKLITTPLTEGIASGEDARPLGTENTDQGAYETPAPYGGSGQYATAGLSGVSQQRVGNDTEFLKEVKRVAQKYNIKEGDLLGLMASESGLDPASDNGSHVGLIQFSASSAKLVGTTQSSLKRMSRAEQMKYVDKYFEYWKLPKGANAGQLYSVVFAPAYASGDPNKVLYSSPSVEYRSNKPLDANKDGKITIAEMGGRIEGKKKEFGISDNITLSQSTQSSPPQQSTPGTGQSFRPLPQGSFKGGESQKFGASRDRGSRRHLGIDITESNWKRGSDPRIPVVAIRGGVVSQRNYVGGSQYLSGLVIDQDDGYSLRYLHMSPSVRPGQKVFAGQRIGRLVDLKNQTHLHIELYSGSKILDPTEYIKTVERGGVPPSIARQQSPTPTPAQITPIGTPQNPQISQSLAPERTGPTVIVSQNPSSPARQMMSSGGGGSSGEGSSQISDFALLNNFIKNKLLLDLAYL
jgi:murein DD-endopeptidase MepM/ murein hydrolase activator NlpD